MGQSNQTIGATIKQIRQSKNLTLKEVADQHLSIAMLSQFENGKNTLSIERFLLILTKLQVSFAEFQLMHGEDVGQAEMILEKYFTLINNTPPNATEEQLAEVSLQAQDLRKRLVAISSAETTQQIEHQKYYLAAINYLYDKLDLTRPWQISAYKTQLEKITFPVHHYLWNVETWGIYELQLINQFSWTFAPENYWTLLKSSIARSQKLAELKGYQFLPNRLMLTGISIFLSNGEVKYASRLLVLLEKTIRQTNDSDGAIMLPFYRGWYYLYLNQVDKAEKYFSQTIEFYQQLNLTEKVAEFKNLRKNIYHTKKNKAVLYVLR